MDLDIVYNYNLPGVAIRLFEAGNQKFSNKLIKLFLVVIAFFNTEQGSQPSNVVAARNRISIAPGGIGGVLNAFALWSIPTVSPSSFLVENGLV